jgi:hypothetical protein
MSILLKNRGTLTQLFADFSLQEASLVNQNLNTSWHLLASAPAQLLLAMKEKQVNIEIFLGKKCLPLIRFYLADKKQQKDTFLSANLLAQLFDSLPTVEAIVFKNQISNAQLVLPNASQKLSSQLSREQKVETVSPVVQINSSKPSNIVHTRQLLNRLAETEKQYLNCFYYLNAGELFIAPEEETIDVDTLLYSELYPLQQLAAQKIFMLTGEAEPIEYMPQQGISA